MIGVEDNLALNVARAPPGSLNEGGLASEEPFLIRVQNRHERNFRQIQTLAQEVNADQRIERALAQSPQNIHAPDGINIRVEIFAPDADIGEVLRQVFAGAFRERGDECSPATLRRGADFFNQVVDLPG